MTAGTSTDAVEPMPSDTVPSELVDNVSKTVGMGFTLGASTEDVARAAIKATLEELRKWERDNHLPGHACARRFARSHGVELDGGES